MLAEFGSSWVVGVGVFAVHVLGVLHAVDALMKVRSAKATVAWILGLTTFPYAALPLYWLFGRDRLEGYVRARRSKNRRLVEVRRELSRVMEEARVAPVESKARVFELMDRLLGMPLTGGNVAEIFVDGKETFEEMFEEIAGAKEELLVCFFILKDDRLGTRFKEALMDRAKAGVTVRVVYDEVGSHKLSKKYVEDLEAAGVEVAGFGNRRPWRRFTTNFRNHRKIVLIDGRKAFVGGLNVGDEYLGRSKRFGNWRDTHLKLEGPAAAGIKLCFFEDWNWATGKVPKVGPLPAPVRHGGPAMALPTGPADRVAGWHSFVAQAAGDARERLWISSPYFVPDDAVLVALQSAALRGVDVRVMLPDKIDHYLVWFASYTFYEQTIPLGVKILRYTDGFLHQKALLVDNDLAYVGSANLDNRSLFLNFEVGAVGCHPKAVGVLKEVFEEDFRSCREVAVSEFTGRSFSFRVVCHFSRLFSPVL